MYVQHPRRRRAGRRAAHLRAAALLRGAASRARLPRGARHHVADLRHLPDRLPDERRQRDRGRLRRHRRRPAARAAAAALLRRVDREPRAARADAARARLPRLRERHRDGARPRRHRAGGAAAEEGRQPSSSRSSGGARSTRSTCASAASTARRPGGSSPRVRESLERGARDRARAHALGRRRSRSRTSSRTTSSSRCRTPSDYAIERGRIVSSAGLDIDVREYDEHFVEEHVEHSNALHSRLRERGAYCVGPMARFALNGDRLSPLGPRRSPPRSGLDAGGVPEPVPQHPRAVRRARLRLRRGAAADRRAGSRPSDPPSSSCPAKATGYGCSEAPRGLLYHRYSIDGDGVIRDATIVPPTSQNQRIIERDLAAFVGHHQHLPDDALTLACEQAIRNYDPCISCATHFLQLEVDRA